MRRRKGRVYVTGNKRSKARFSPDKESAEKSLSVDTSHDGVQVISTLTHHDAVVVNPNSSLGIRLPGMFDDSDVNPSLKAAALRQLLQKVSGLNAILSWVISLVGYFDVKDKDESLDAETAGRDGFRAVVCGLSAVQIFLVIHYSTCLLRFMECVRATLRLSPIPVVPLVNSPRAMLNCGLECAFHMLVLPPMVSVQHLITINGTDSVVSLNDFLYMLLLLRNYHSLQFFFWCSFFSNTRAQFFTELADVNVTSWFILRCYLAAYSLKLVMGVYSVIVIISGLAVFVWEKSNVSSDFSMVWNGFWIVAATQTTIGYGDTVPHTFFGQLTMITSCFVGQFILAIIIGLSGSQMALNLTECTMYSELVYTRYKEKYGLLSVQLLQCWWRFMLMRKSHIRDGATIVAFYTHLRQYRSVIATCQRVKDRRFERQIQAFESSTAKQFRAVTEYLQPIRMAEALVRHRQTREVIRTQYRIKLMARKAYKFARRHRPKVAENATSVSSVTFSASPSPEPMLFSPANSLSYKIRVTPSPRSEIRHLARAKVKAHQKLIGRLIKDDSGQNSLASSRSVSPFPS